MICLCYVLLYFLFSLPLIYQDVLDELPLLVLILQKAQVVLVLVSALDAQLVVLVVVLAPRHVVE